MGGWNRTGALATDRLGAVLEQVLIGSLDDNYRGCVHQLFLSDEQVPIDLLQMECWQLVLENHE